MLMFESIQQKMSLPQIHVRELATSCWMMLQETQEMQKITGNIVMLIPQAVNLLIGKEAVGTRW